MQISQSAAPEHSSSLIPVAIVQVLPEQGVGLHGAVGVHLGHVQVIHEVHQPLGAWGAVIPASLFLQRLLQHTWRGRRDWGECSACCREPQPSQLTCGVCGFLGGKSTERKLIRKLWKIPICFSRRLRLCAFLDCSIFGIFTMLE